MHTLKTKILDPPVLPPWPLTEASRGRKKINFFYIIMVVINLANKSYIIEIDVRNLNLNHTYVNVWYYSSALWNLYQLYALGRRKWHHIKLHKNDISHEIHRTYLANSYQLLTVTYLYQLLTVNCLNQRFILAVCKKTVW